MTAHVSIQYLLERIGGVLRRGDAAITIEGVEAIERAGPGKLTFIANKKYSPYLKTTRATAVIVPDEPEFAELGSESPRVVIAHPHPYYAFMLALRIFHPDEHYVHPGIQPTAALGENVRLGQGVHVGRNAVIDDGGQIGDGSVVLPGCYVGRNAKLGRRTMIGPNVTVMHECELGDRVRVHPGTVIGADGFGYAQLDGMHHKIPQVGRVVIEDDVEIGACVCIDRATMGETRIRKGTKIDNLVQIAHNVQIGEHTIIVSQVGISGSTRIGDHVILAGQAGLIGHLKIGDGAIIAAQSGIAHDVPPNTRMLGSPARELGLERRIHVLIGRLPELVKQIKNLNERLTALEKQVGK